MQHIYLYILLLLSSLSISAQNAPKPTQDTAEQDTTFINRLSFRTNAVYWLMTIPNVAIEFDIVNSQYNKWTLGVEGKYNWNTSHSLLPSSVFDLWEVRPEVRRYWRTDFRSSGSGKMSFKDRLFSRYREKPRYWRAYYAGLYTSAAGYTLKFGEEGIKGVSYGFGVSGGFGIPLYSFRQHYIDLEFGASLGVEFAQYDKFIHDFDNNAYVNLPEKSRSMHFVPYPLITDVHVSFVYRFGNSIKSKYKKIDHEKIQMREVEKQNRRIRKDSIRQAKQLEDSLQHLRKLFVKDSIRNERIVKDSLKSIQSNVKNQQGTKIETNPLIQAEKKKETNRSEAEATESKKEEIKKEEKSSRKKRKKEKLEPSLPPKEE